MRSLAGRFTRADILMQVIISHSAINGKERSPDPAYSVLLAKMLQSCSSFVVILIIEECKWHMGHARRYMSDAYSSSGTAGSVVDALHTLWAWRGMRWHA